MSHIVPVGLALTHTVFPTPCTPRAEGHRREAEVGWLTSDWLTSPDSASAAQQQKGLSEQGVWRSPRPLAGPSTEKKPYPASCPPSWKVVKVFACPDINFSPILGNYWICYDNNPDNCTTDLYLLLYCYLEINCLSLKLLWFLLQYPRLIKTWQGHLKPLQYNTHGARYRLWFWSIYLRSYILA